MGIVWDSEQGATCPLCKRAKKACNCTRKVVDEGDGIVRLRGAGGTLDGCDAEIQGDHRDLIRAELVKLELTVKG